MPVGHAWTTKEIAAATLSRFINATGQPFVTLDSPEVREGRCANELLVGAFKAKRLPAAELFVKSPQSSRDTIEIGDNLNGEWFTQMRIGEHVKLGNDVNLLGHGFVELHDNVKLGNGVTVDTIGHPNDPDLRQTAFTGTVIIEKGAQIGAGTIIRAGAGETLVIGKGARIANDSIVLKSVKDNETVGGVPAKPAAGVVECSMERQPLRPEGFQEINTQEAAHALFGAEADIKLPIFIKGDTQHLKVEGAGRIGINREAMFDLQGDLTIQAPFQMASRASVQVQPGAHATLAPGSFLYTACKVVAEGDLRIGENAIVGAGAQVDRNVDDNTMVVSHNRNLGLVTRKTYDPVPDDWKKRTSLPPKVAAFGAYKASKEGMPVEDIKQFAVDAANDLFKNRTRDFAAESRFLREEFAKLAQPD